MGLGPRLPPARPFFVSAQKGPLNMPIENGKVIFHAKIRSVTDQGVERIYEGDFTVRQPTFADMGAISAAISRMAQGQPIVDMTTGAVLNAIAGLSILVEDAPDWWDEVQESQNTPVLLAVNTILMEERGRSPFRAAEVVREEDPPSRSGSPSGSGGSGGDS